MIFFSIYIYGAKFSLFNWHQAVGKIEICSCIFNSQMGRLLSTPLLLSLHASYQIIDRRYVVIESQRYCDITKMSCRRLCTVYNIIIKVLISVPESNR